MKTHAIKGKTVQIDETRRYLDYALPEGLASIDFPGILEGLENGSLSIDTPGNFEDFLKPLTRWVNEAPRKRFYRKLVIEGKGLVMIGGGENFFVDDLDGEKIIDDLEATGKLAVYLRKELFGLEDVSKVEDYAQSWYEKGVYHEKGENVKGVARKHFKLKTPVFVINRRMRAGIKKHPKNSAEACTICKHLIPVNTPRGIGYDCNRKKCRFSMG